MKRFIKAWMGAVDWLLMPFVALTWLLTVALSYLVPPGTLARMAQWCQRKARAHDHD